MRIKALARPAVAAAILAAVIATPSAVGADDRVQPVPAIAVAGGDAPHGVWLDEQGRGAIEIAPCDSGLCGRLVWTKDAGKLARAACGMQIIGDVKRIDAATWNGGWIYSPELKSRFDVELKPIDGESLQVTGFAGSRDMSETMIWRRAPADLGRCGGPERAGYVAATVVDKSGKVAGAAGAAAGAAGVAAVAVAAAPKRAKAAADKPAVKTAKAAVKAERRPTRVAEAKHERPHQHSAGCHVRAPFVSVSFRCSSKASRVLARLF